MDVYRQKLCASFTEEEMQSIQVWPQGETLSTVPSRPRRAFSKYLSYPLRVSSVGRAELIHLLDHSSAHLLPLVKKSILKVVTVHDLIPLRDGMGLTDSQVQRFRKNMKLLKLADRLISVSHYTKGEIINILGVDESKITVIPNGVDPIGETVADSSLVNSLKGSEQNVVVLSIGSTVPRKNVGVLPEVFSRLEKITPGKFCLLRVGGKLPKNDSVRLKNVLGDRFHEAGFLSDMDLKSAYSSSQVVLVPSFFEGFGLPVIEAFSAGTAVACSDRSSLPEVSAGLAQLFNPDDLDDIVRAVLAASDDECAARKSERVAFSKQFTWRNHAESLFEVYRELGVELLKS